MKFKNILILLFCLSFDFIFYGEKINASSLKTAFKKSIVILKGQGSDASGVIIGKNFNNYYILTVKHFLSEIKDHYDVELPSGNLSKLKIIKIFADYDLAIGKFQSKEQFFTLPINKFLPYPAPYTPETFQYDYLKLRSEFDTVKTVARVGGFSIPTNAVKLRLFRVIDASLVALVKNNIDGYNLLYQASTVPGMSGGAVVGFRDCTMDRGGFTLTISPALNFPSLVGIHGRSEDYHGEGRSGISLGIPIEGQIKEFLISKKTEYGIPYGETEIRDIVNKQYCL